VSFFKFGNPYTARLVVTDGEHTWTLKVGRVLSWEHVTSLSHLERYKFEFEGLVEEQTAPGVSGAFLDTIIGPDLQLDLATRVTEKMARKIDKELTSAQSKKRDLPLELQAMLAKYVYGPAKVKKARPYLVGACRRHPRYRAKRKPTSRCRACHRIWRQTGEV
jgi:hypothetical protein